VRELGVALTPLGLKGSQYTLLKKVSKLEQSTISPLYVSYLPLLSYGISFFLSSVPSHLSEEKRRDFKVNMQVYIQEIRHGIYSQLADLFIVQNGGEILQNENSEHKLLHSVGDTFINLFESSQLLTSVTPGYRL